VRLMTCIAFGCVWMSEGRAAPPAGDSTPVNRNSPVLIEMVEPIYPKDAEPNIHGDVTLHLLVGPDGQVSQATAIDGPEVFFASAIDAATRLRFQPAMKNGQPIGSTIHVYFHFAPPTSALEHGENVIVIHADHPDIESIQTRTSLNASELARHTDSSLAETIVSVPGVTLSKGSSDSSKPIIRGHHERRLLVLYDGIRHESQKWGPDHATEIDPFSAGDITIVRGAAGTRYGPDAIGGVIMVDPPPMRLESGFSGKGVLSYSTNGNRLYEAARLNWVPQTRDQISFRLEGNHAQGESLHTPDYILGNTASEMWNLGTATQLSIPNGSLRLSFHHHALKAGIFYGVQQSTPEDFEAQLNSEQPQMASSWRATRDIDRPYQQVSHDLAALHLSRYGSWGKFDSIYAFQRNHRQEFEQVRESVTGPQYDFILRTHSLDIFYGHPESQLSFAEIDGGLGFQAGFQENVYRGLPLIPNYRSLGLSIFGTERISFQDVDLEMGARLDHLSRNAFLDELSYERHLRRESLQKDQCQPDGGVFACPHTDTTGSFSLGTLVHLVPEKLDFKIDLSNANRFPNIDELYLIGSAPSYPVYANGQPDLGVERTYSASSTLGLRLWWIHSEVSAFVSRINNYINFAPALKSDGSLHYDVTIQGTWPRYGFQPINASTYGLDGLLEFGPNAPVGFVLNGATVRTQKLGASDQLVGTPPDSIQAECIGRLLLGPRFEGTEVAISGQQVRQQHLSNPVADFAPPPEGYFLLGARVETQLILRRQTLRLGLNGHNILNTQYREYTSLLRYYADMPGRNLQLRVGVDF
jgi:iron complex outermembrane recepter protein